MNARSFLIVGCQRSGTTLLRLVLDSHSRIRCHDEFHTSSVLSSPSAAINADYLVGLKAPMLTEQLGHERLVIGLSSFSNSYASQKLLFVVRDVRDVVASMLALKVDGRPWLEGFALPWLKYRSRMDERFHGTYASTFAKVQDARYPRVAGASVYWRTKVDSYFEYLNRGFPQLLIRYEDLVARPRLELLRICGFLEIPWEDSLLCHPSFPHTELLPDGLAIGGTNPLRPIDTRSIKRWRLSLSNEEITEVFHFCGDAQRILYGDSEIG